MLQPATDRTTSLAAPEQRTLRQLDACLNHGCVICIEHVQAVRPGYTAWELWEAPCCYDGDLDALHTEIENCRCAYPDHCIRLTVRDLTARSKLCLAVHRPALAA